MQTVPEGWPGVEGPVDPFAPGFVCYPDEAPEMPAGWDYDPAEDMDDEEADRRAAESEALRRIEAGLLF